MHFPVVVFSSSAPQGTAHSSGGTEFVLLLFMHNRGGKQPVSQIDGGSRKERCCGRNFISRLSLQERRKTAY